jgi:hypothetical protein
MSYDEESYVLESIEQIKKETHENNVMLKQIIKVINTYLARHHQENEEDFGRNVLANLISSTIDINRLFKRR